MVIRNLKEELRNAVRARSKPWLCIGILAALAMLLVGRSLVGEAFLPLDIIVHLHPWRFSYERVPVNNPINSDVVLQIYPRRLVAYHMLRQGAWPLWDPTRITGTPLLAEGQLAFFYPPSLLFVLLPLWHAFGYYALVQLILSGSGSYFFARQLKLSYGAATLTGIAYMFSGFMLTWLQVPEFTGAAAMLPWCFWAVERACALNRPWRWLFAGIVLAMPLFTHIQIAFYTYIGVGCYVLARLMQRQSWRSRRNIVLGFSAALVVALGLSAVQLLPDLALAGEGQRTEQVTFEGSFDGEFRTLIDLVLPLFDGTPRTAPGAWGPSLLTRPQPYAGLAVLLLAMLALITSRHPATTIFGLLAAGSFAIGAGSPLLILFVRFVPAYHQFSDHARWFVLWGFAVAVLAGLGSQALIDGWSPMDQRERRTIWITRIFLTGLIIFLAIWAWQHLAFFTAKSLYGVYMSRLRQRLSVVPLLIGALSVLALLLFTIRRIPRAARWALLLTVTAGDLSWYGGGYNTVDSVGIFHPTTDLLAALSKYPAPVSPTQPAYPPTRQIAFLKAQPQPFRIYGEYEVVPPNIAGVFGLEDVRGYQSLYLARYSHLVRLIDGSDYRKLAGEGATSFKPYLTKAYHHHRRLLDMLNVQFFLFSPGSKTPPLFGPLDLIQQDDEGSIYRNPNVLPRAWLVHDVEVIPEDERQLDRLAQSDFDPARAAVLPTLPPPLSQPGSPDRVEAVTYRPNQLRVVARSTAAGLLIVSDAYASGWHAAVDGKPATLYRANYALRGVWLPAGRHAVTFTYRPSSFVLGGIISLITLLAVSGASWWSWRRAGYPQP